MRRSSSGRCQSQILVENRDFHPSYEGPRWNIAMAFGTENLEWYGYVMLNKI